VVDIFEMQSTRKKVVLPLRSVPEWATPPSHVGASDCDLSREMRVYTLVTCNVTEQVSSRVSPLVYVGEDVDGSKFQPERRDLPRDPRLPSIRTPIEGESSSIGGPIPDATMVDHPGTPDDPEATMVDVDATMVDGVVEGVQPPPSARARHSGLFASAAVLKPGDVLGERYEIQQLLGEGGMGAVYKAKDRELDRFVALKVIRPELAASPAILARFKQELLLAHQVTHKNVIRIYDLSEADGVRFITMEFIAGADLRSLLVAEGKFKPEYAVEVIRQVCLALDAAHSVGVIHRDLKPQNIMRDKQGRILVMDFGLARSVESAGMTQTGALVGTMEYMSPEQALGTDLDHRSDLFAVGLIFYELLSGKVPYKADTAIASLLKRTRERAVPVSDLDPSVPTLLSNIVNKCLERDLKLRYQSAREILDDLESGHSPSRSRSLQISLPQISLTMPERYRGWYLAAAATLVLGLVGGLAIPQVRNLVFRHGSALSSGTGTPQVEQGKYVAVLPFRVIGDENALRYVADGLGEALSAKLFQVKDLHLAAASAVKNVDSTQPLAKIAHELGVNLIVHGTVQGSGDKLRIIASLDDVVAGRSIWTEEFSGVPQDLLTLEDQMYSKLISAMELHLSNQELASTTAHPTENFDAYDSYLRGRNAMRGQQDPKNVNAAIAFYEQALKRDPRFALAYAGLADADLQMYLLNKESSWAQKATSAAQQAGYLNENLVEVHLALGSVYSQTGKAAEAVAELQRALKLAPNSDEAYRRLGAVYVDAGRKDEAIQAYKKAVEVNPYFWMNYNDLGLAYYNLGMNEEAVSILRKVIELEPENAAGYDNLGAVYLRMERWSDCIPNFEKALQIQPYFGTYSNLGTAYFFLKRYNDAVKMFEKAVAMNPNEHMAMGNLADGYRWAGRRPEALATYDKAIALAFKQLAINPRDANAMGYLAQYFAKKGDPQRGLEFIARARSIAPSEVSLIYFQAAIYCLAGKNNEALKALHQALQQGYPVQEAQNDPELKDIQGLPEFAAMVRDFGGKSN
jgi:serine/threonine protein kinase/tetratricopeptide (TPR) repeat protein